MIGTIERIKNSVLLKCSTLNDEVLSKTLIELIDTRIYQFSEEMVSMLGAIGSFTEEDLRKTINDIIKTPIIKKIKRKLFIDSLALQITNDTFIEDNISDKISIDKIKKTYVKELEDNKSSNQLNMTENLNLDEIINGLRLYVDNNIVSLISENSTLSKSIVKLVDDLKSNLQTDLKRMIEDLDLRYQNILIDELELENKNKVKEEKGDDDMFEELSLKSNILEEVTEKKEEKNIFDSYDDMTLFNKVILSLNTQEEKLSRMESNLKAQKEEVDKKLASTNKEIESNIERENELTQRKATLDKKQVELNSKLSETEVIFLNMKPLIKGLSKIKDSNDGGNENE